MSSIKLDNVSVSFNLKQNQGVSFKSQSNLFYALKNLTLSINSGDRVAIIGNSGAGKTTLLKVLSQILPPSQGTLELEGELHAVLALSSIGILGSASCMENILLAGYYHGFSSKTIGEYVKNVCEKSGVDKFLFQPASTLSQKMKSRLALSMAMVSQSDILVFDDWIGAMERNIPGDSSFSDAIDKSDILIFSTGIMKLVEKYCNRCLILEGGELIHDTNVKKAIAIFNKQQKN